MNRTTRIKITELNPHVICVLCGGYYINATTITECLHSFCRTCITRYLETSKYCPVCDVMVHKTRPLDYIRSDKTLQDLVYKLVPGLYKSEMKRRREYYAAVDTPGVSQPPSEDRGDEFYDRIIYTEDEKISLSLELCADGIPFKTPINVHGHTGPENIRIKDVRYLQCPAAFSIGNLKKFIRMKFDLKMKFEIDIFHTAEPLPDYYSLMDIAYIYTWTRRAPLRLYYTVFVKKLPPKAPDPISRDQSNPISRDQSNKVNNEEEPVTTASKIAKAEDKHMNKKRKLLEGPDDISPDLDFEKCKPYKGERRNVGRLGTPKKRAKKVLVEVDNSVKEAMSESEEQLAKLTLDCSGDVKNGSCESGSVSSNAKADNTKKDADVKNHKDGSTNFGSQKENVKNVTKLSNKSKRDDKCDSDILTNINIETNTPIGSEICDKNGALQTEKDTASSTQSSAQVSPGSGSISLSLFQPLNEIAVEVPSSKIDNNDNVNVKNRDKTFDFQSEESGTVKKSRGRPKGSKNKTTQEKNGSAKTNETKADTESKNSLVVSKNHPGLKSPKGNESLKKADTPSKKCVVKGNINTEIDKVSMNKNKSENGEKVKRKYVRKKKAENSEENSKEVKRQKKDNNKVEDCKNLENVTYMQGEVDEISSSDRRDKDNVSGCGLLKESIGKEIPPKHIESDKDSVQTKLNNTNEQVSVNSSSLQEPVTPLYGETPKVNESNQGLPCSPNMDSFGEGGRLIIDTSVDNEDNDDANTKDTSDHTIVKDKNAHSNGAISEKINMKSGDMVSNRAMSKETFRNGFGIYDGNQSLNTSLSNSDIPNAHSDQYRSAINALSPSNTILGSFSPAPLNAHVHIGHVTGSDFSSHDQNFDQPLDLTNNGTRDEYTKGKIFKTKMLKKSYPKQETVQCLKEKSTSSVNQIIN